MWNDMGMGWGYGWIVGGTALVLTLVIIALIIWALVVLTRAPIGQGGAEAPRTVLDRRFASGEISAQEYAAARRLMDERSTTVN